MMLEKLQNLYTVQKNRNICFNTQLFETVGLGDEVGW
jgi:hypothetical protein